MRRTLAGLWLALLAGCATTLELEDLDRLERSLEARTVALEPDYSLWSPFALRQTQTWVAMLDEELAASRELFGARLDGRLMVVLVPLEGLGPQASAAGGRVSFAPAGEHPLHGLAGAAGGGQVIIYVTPDRVLEAGSGPVVAHRAASDYRGTLRHEFAHVHARAAGLDGARWFNEGVADLVQSHALEEGRLVDRGPDDVTLLVAHTFAPEQWGLGHLLDWREDGQRIVAGKEPVDEVSRTLCGLFVRFLLEGRSEEGLIERLRAIQEMSRSELLALEPAWRAWLADTIEGLGGGLLRGTYGGAGKPPPSH